MMKQRISDKLDPHKLDTNKKRAFWALDQLENSDKDRFSCSNIASFLIEKHGIKTSRQAIEYGLKTDKRSTHKNKKGYKLMENGRKKLKDLLPKSDEVIVIEPGKPFSAKSVHLKTVFGKLENALCISDPFVDSNTLDLIYRYMNKKTSIRILTVSIVDKPSGSFARQLAELRHEGYQVEVRVYSKSDLHDRYVFDKKSFWLSGNSFNHLGRKESFLVSLGEDIRQSMETTFEHRWKASKNIKPFTTR